MSRPKRGLMALLLHEKGIRQFYGPGLHEDWRHNLHAKLTERFAPLFQDSGNVVIVVDTEGGHFVVESIDDIEVVWRGHAVECAFSVPNKAFEAMKGELAFSQLLVDA